MAASGQIHATCVSICGHGVIIRGASGSGKSDLALRLIEQGGELVADDRVNITRVGDQVVATYPPEISGLLEVRGFGIVRLKPLNETRINLVVDLVESRDVPRLPEAQTTEIQDIPVRFMRLNAFEASTPAKIRLALGVGLDAKLEMP